MARLTLPESLNKQRRALTKFWLNYRLPVIAVAVGLIVLVGGWFAWTTLQQSMSESSQNETSKVAEWIAKDVNAALEEMGATVDQQLDLPALAKLLADDEQDTLRAQEEALTAAIDGALGVRILERQDDRKVDADATPPVTYAALQMMRAAAVDGEAPNPEVLLFGEPEQHIALLRALSLADADGVIGFVLVGMDVELIASTVAKAQNSSTYIEVGQGGGKNAKVLGTKGRAALRQGVPTLTVPIQGSQMRVRLWADEGEAVADESVDSIVPMIGAVAALALAAFGAVFFVKKRKAQTDDVVVRDEASEAAAVDKLVKKLSGETGGVDDVDEAEVEAAVNLANEAAAIEVVDEDELHDEIFRAYDVRGVVGKTLTVNVVKRLGLAIGSEAYERGQQTLCVARDGRASSPELTAALIEGLRESGRDVIDVGEVPTPVLYFSTYYLDTGSGVMVTGSHNAPEYNGLKIMLAGDTLFGDDIQRLRQRIIDEEFVTGAGNAQAMDIAADYIRRVSEDVPVALGNAFKVVIDCGNGVAGNLAPKLIRALGHDVVELFCEVDGNFPNHHPDPSQPENLQDLIAAVRANDADLGFAFDGDGDRLGVVDSEGKILWPDSQMMLFARDVLSRNAGAEIVYDVKCSSRLGKVISKLGGKPLMYKTGHSFMKNKLKETGAPLAGEMSGHIFFKERWYGFDDALYAAARMLEILMGFKQRPAEVFSKLPAGVSTHELVVKMNEGENVAFMQSFGESDEFAGATVSTIDGIRVDWPDRWGLVRASNTNPSLVLRFEGDTEQALEEVKGTFRKLLLDKKPDLPLPF